MQHEQLIIFFCFGIWHFPLMALVMNDLESRHLHECVFLYTFSVLSKIKGKMLQEQKSIVVPMYNWNKHVLMYVNSLYYMRHVFHARINETIKYLACWCGLRFKHITTVYGSRHLTTYIFVRLHELNTLIYVIISFTQQWTFQVTRENTFISSFMWVKVVTRRDTRVTSK